MTWRTPWDTRSNYQQFMFGPFEPVDILIFPKLGCIWCHDDHDVPGPRSPKWRHKDEHHAIGMSLDTTQPTISTLLTEINTYFTGKSGSSFSWWSSRTRWEDIRIVENFTHTNTWNCAQLHTQTHRHTRTYTYKIHNNYSIYLYLYIIVYTSTSINQKSVIKCLV